MKTEHILIIRFSALGDVAMTVPVVYSLAKQYPDVRITMLSKPFARPLFEDLAPNVGFMEADLANEYHGLKGLNALYRRLTAKNFTAIADLHNVIRSDYLRMRFNFDRYRVAHLDKHRLQRRQLVSYNNKVLEPIPSAFDNYAKVFEQLGYPVHLEFTSLLTPEQAGLSQLPEGYHIKKPFQQWIGIAPFAAHRGKAYSLAQMEKAKEDAVNILWNADGATSNMVNYLIEHELLPDAEQHYAFSQHSTHEQRLADMNFYMRYNRRSKY